MAEWDNIFLAPKDGTLYLAYGKECGGYALLRYDGSPGYLAHGGFTHWHPLPEPPPEIPKVSEQEAKQRQAHMAVFAAVKTGEIARTGCIKCGRPAIAHHEDYDKPLEVIWLCRSHHMLLHKIKKQESPESMLEAFFGESLQ